MFQAYCGSSRSERDIAEDRQQHTAGKAQGQADPDTARQCAEQHGEHGRDN